MMSADRTARWGMTRDAVDPEHLNLSLVGVQLVEASWDSGVEQLLIRIPRTTMEEISRSFRPAEQARRGGGPLNWRTAGGYTPEGVRRSHHARMIPAGAVASMLDAADEEHGRRMHVENERGGEARQVVADVAKALGVDIDEGPGRRWDADHMRRVVDGVTAMVRDRDYLTTTCCSLRDLLRKENERADAAIAREEAADELAEQFEAERDEAREQRDTYRALYYAKPARMVLSAEDGELVECHAALMEARRELREEREKNASSASAPRLIFHTTASSERPAADVLEDVAARKRAAPGRVWWTSTAEEHTTTDEELQRLAESVAVRVPLDSLVSDLKNVIVSQAREIARLKGERE